MMRAVWLSYMYKNGLQHSSSTEMSFVYRTGLNSNPPLIIFTLLFYYYLLVNFLPLKKMSGSVTVSIWRALQWWKIVVTVDSLLLSPTCTLASSATLAESGFPRSKPSSTASIWTGTSARTAETETLRALSCLVATTTMSTTGSSLRRLKTWRSEVSSLFCLLCFVLNKLDKCLVEFDQ